MDDSAAPRSGVSGTRFVLALLAAMAVLMVGVVLARRALWREHVSGTDPVESVESAESPS